MYQTVSEINLANVAAGGRWFHEDEMRAFGTSIPSERVYGGKYFITRDYARRTWLEPKQYRRHSYNVRQCIDGRVGTVHNPEGDGDFPTYEAAEAFINDLIVNTAVRYLADTHGVQPSGQ